MSETTRTLSVWSDAMLAAALFAIDPVGLGGIVIRSGPGPARDVWLLAMQGGLPADAPVRRIPVRIEDDRLLGGLDLSASLVAGRPIVERGVLAACDGGVAILAMAERMEEALGARVASVIDQGEVLIERDGLTTRLPARIGLIALDEGLEPDERPPEALLDRLAFRIDLSGLSARDRLEQPYDRAAVAAARRRVSDIEPGPDAVIEALCEMSGRLGVGSSRPALLALRTARAHAALSGRLQILEEDVAIAARLVLAPRTVTGTDDEAGAAEAPAEAPSEAPDTRPPAESDLDPNDRGPNVDTLITAIQAALPEGLLEKVKTDGPRPGRSIRGNGSGESIKSAQRGRPVGSRHGALRGGDRLNLSDTLRAATPWQKLRSAGPGEALVQVRQEDFRIRRFVQRREATTIFLVDGSGSAANQRLAEAKGAVEMLLAKAYVSRSRVALIAFRNSGAQVLLEATRSLTRAKRSLADLPGGGGTPLAIGLDSALRLAQAEKTKDRTPLIVILTDGRANIGRGGAPGRSVAESDAMSAARNVREAGVGAVFIDTSPRPQPGGDRFAVAMGAVYAPLPYLEAEGLSALVSGLSARFG